MGAIGVVVAGIQSDLGSTGVIVLMLATLAFVAGLPFKRILLLVASLAIGLILAYQRYAVSSGSLANYLHPEANCQTTGYQACQALIAVGSGGMIGLALGEVSRPTATYQKRPTTRSLRSMPKYSASSVS